MRKQLLIPALGMLSLGLVLFTGCSKDEDTTAPSISLVGNADTTIAKGSSWSDPGATALDDEDGNITSSISVSGSVNTAVAGVYTLTYSVSDKAGNSTSASRRVTVSWTGAQLAGTYNVNDTCVIGGVDVPEQYTSVATASAGNTYRASFTNLSNVFTGSTYFDVVGDAFTMPEQRPNGSTSQFKVSGNGTISVSGSNVIWRMNYQVTDTATNTTTNCRATFVSQ
jgi:hypothetical protein